MIEFIKGLLGGRDTLPEYILVEKQVNPELVVTGVRITSGHLKGMVFTTSPTVNFKKNESGEISLKYEYLIQVPPSDAPVDDPSIEKIVGDIIVDIIAKNHTEGS